jgi:hypothetical protein
MPTTLGMIEVNKLQAGDYLILNHVPHLVRYMEKDSHGFDIYLTNNNGIEATTYVSDGEKVIITK